MPDFQDFFSAEDLSLLESKSHLRKFKRREIIFSEGNAPAGVHYLRSGKVKVFTTDTQGREQIIHLAKPGDLMGYRAVLGNDTYSASGEALENSETWFIPKAVFFTLLEKNAAFSHSVIKLLTAELRHAEHHLAGLARKPVKSRLAEVLLLLADTYGFEKDKQTIAVSLTREELAGLVGTATETTIRLLHALKEENLVATPGKKLRLLNVERLRLLAGNG